MAKKKYEAQFSIYKVDYNRSAKYFEDLGIKIESYSQLESKILEEVRNNVQKKNKTKNYSR